MINIEHFTEKQKQHLKEWYGIIINEDLIELKDGLINHESFVWWKADDGPEKVKAKDHFDNIRHYPQFYSLSKPKTIYVED